MRILLTLLISIAYLSANSQKMKEYKIEIKIDASKEKVWKAITDFENYPKWNSVLRMQNNDSLIVGNKFHVTITQPNGKQSKFKAKIISKEKLESFVGTQTMFGKWFFKATHHFIVKEIDKKNTLFIQKWEFNGIIASLFRKQIFKELAVFNTMNKEFKECAEK